MPAEPETTTACAITQQDFQILLEGSGSSRFAPARDISIGTLVSALLGVVSLDSAVQDWTKASSSNVVWLAVLLALTFASFGLALTFLILTLRDPGRESFRVCKERIERALASQGGAAQSGLPSPASASSPATISIPKP